MGWFVVALSFVPAFLLPYLAIKKIAPIHVSNILFLAVFTASIISTFGLCSAATSLGIDLTGSAGDIVVLGGLACPVLGMWYGWRRRKTGSWIVGPQGFE